VESVELLLEAAQEYELRAVSLGDASSLSEENAKSAFGFVVVAIALREVAQALDEAA
jgi:hypothetical protein